MTTFTVKFGSIKEALGKVRAGWLVFENGCPGYPHLTKEAAVTHAEATAKLRTVGGLVPLVVVVERDK